MKRGRILGLMVATLVMAAAAPAASDAAPTWHYCAKTVPKNTGDYSDKLCTVASSPGHGKYELQTGVGKKPTKGKAVGRSRFIVAIPRKAELHIECEKGSVASHTVAPSGLSGVILSGSKCSWQGGECDTIQSRPMSGSLGWYDSATGKAGISLTNEKEPNSGVLFEVNCEEGVKFRITGAFTGEISPSGGLSKTHTLSFRVGEYLSEPPPGEIVNPPEFEERFVGTLLTEYLGEETEYEYTPEGGIPSGLEATYALTGEALGIS